MNYPLITLEILVVLAGLALLLVDLWTPAEKKRRLGYYAAAALGVVFLLSFAKFTGADGGGSAFGGMFLQDSLALFFKRFFLLAAILVLLMSVEFADRFEAGIAEYYALILFALSGMMIAASANDFILVFVALELITVTFYVLTSFQRRRVQSLEAGVKYLILGALAAAFMVFGIALIFGTANTTNFGLVAFKARELMNTPVFILGLLLVLVGLGFKIAAFPFQIWAPDVYQGAPTPTTAFLAVGSKAAGFALLLRMLFSAVPDVALGWEKLLMIVAAVTILYGNLCAIPQRNLKRLLGYSSIANAGYLLLGVAALTTAGSAAILYFFAGYLFTVLAAFTVIALVARHAETEDISTLAGLNQRSPLLAASMTLAMVSLAGVPPLAGFFGKFLLLKAVAEQAVSYWPYWWLLAVAIVGVVISLYYYFGVIRAIYWSGETPDLTPIEVSRPIRYALYACAAGMLYLGLFPGAVVNLATEAVKALRL
ncbi:MAG: NADH-quinone oxidoreductase subunit N [Verrucomicrobia bacterium]|nr:NADH-quinone oxidoreductase subunit N [Verrucomicrobiota bacterium]